MPKCGGLDWEIMAIFQPVAIMCRPKVRICIVSVCDNDKNTIIAIIQIERGVTMVASCGC